MPSDSARSPTAAGTGEPPMPTLPISSWWCGRAVGMVEQAREEVRGAAAGRQGGLVHRGEREARIPHVLQVDGQVAQQRAEQTTLHPDRVADGRAHEHGARRQRAHRRHVVQLAAHRAVRVDHALGVRRRPRREADHRGRVRLGTRRLDGGAVDADVVERDRARGQGAGVARRRRRPRPKRDQVAAAPGRRGNRGGRSGPS